MESKIIKVFGLTHEETKQLDDLIVKANPIQRKAIMMRTEQINKRTEKIKGEE